MFNSKLKRLTNKVCLVTGAGRGIGRNISVALGHEGCALALTDIDTNRLSLVQSELMSQGIVAEIFVSDLSQKGCAHNLVQAVVEKFGKIELMINNARSGRRLTYLDESEDNWDLTLGVNLKAIFFLAQAAIPYMPKESSIINIGSVSGQFVSNESPSYQISKAGLLHLTRYLAVNSSGVRVNSVLPGFIVQDEHRDRYELDDADQEKYRSIVEALHPMRSGPGFSDDIADAVVFLASEEAKFINGQSLVVDGGLTIQDPTMVLFNSAFNRDDA